MIKMKWHSLRLSEGFTLIETIIVLAVIGLFTVIVVASSSGTTSNQRFNGEVHDFADNLRRAQTQSYTTQTGSASACGSMVVCYWRGNIVTATVQDVPDATYATDLLFGQDYSKFASSSDISVGPLSTGQTIGITGSQAESTANLNGTRIIAVSIAGIGSVASGTKVRLAFMSPDGLGYVCAASGSVCDPAVNGLTNYVSASVTFTIADTATKLVSKVTYNPQTGSISITS